MERRGERIWVESESERARVRERERASEQARERAIRARARARERRMGGRRRERSATVTVMVRARVRKNKEDLVCVCEREVSLRVRGLRTASRRRKKHATGTQQACHERSRGQQSPGAVRVARVISAHPSPAAYTPCSSRRPRCLARRR
eukprot:6204289-Pleurochrysis_carterae.AAC.1